MTHPASTVRCLVPSFFVFLATEGTDDEDDDDDVAVAVRGAETIVEEEVARPNKTRKQLQ